MGAIGRCRINIGTEASGYNAKGRSLVIGHTAMTLEERLAKIEALLAVLVDRQQVREFYEVEEFARLVGRDRFTVREWARHGRIKADKRLSGRGAHAQWVVSHDEFLRYQREGLLPLGRLE
jgi:hypothetical protein